MERVYRISFNFTAGELSSYFEGLTRHDRDNISDLLPEGYFEHTDSEGRYIVYMLIRPADCKRYSEILDSNLIVHSVRDVSNNLLQQGQFMSNIFQNVNNKNVDRWRKFNKLVETWLLSQYDIDMILDRISKVGIQNLSRTEKIFLEGYRHE